MVSLMGVFKMIAKRRASTGERALHTQARSLARLRCNVLVIDGVVVAGNYSNVIDEIGDIEQVGVQVKFTGWYLGTKTRLAWSR